MAKIRIKKTRGKTWKDLTGDDYFDKAFMDKVGQTLVECIVFEAGKDFSRQGRKPTPPHQPEGIPRSVAFFESFGYTTLSHNSLEVYSTWPWIEDIIKGKPPYAMTWLTRQSGVDKVPMQQKNGTVVIRTTPTTPGEAWVHPGFQKHTFVRRGYEKARRKINSMVSQQMLKVLTEVPFI